MRTETMRIYLKSHYPMRNKIIAMLMMAGALLGAKAQVPVYEMVNGEVTSPKEVSLSLVSYSKEKKFAFDDAKWAALYLLMFDGVPGTVYARPLLPQGNGILSERPSYFENLRLYQMDKMVKRCTMESKFGKAERKAERKSKGRDKATLFTVVVDYMQLRKELEKNNIKKQLGI